MNNVLEELFKDYYPVSGTLFELNNINIKDYNYFCIVEGSTDEKFYSSINKNIIDLNNSIVYYVYQQHIGNKKILEGKKRVITSYENIFIKNKFHKDLNKYKGLNKLIFIVDHDYDGIDKEYNISVTKLYAIENYFVLNQNIKKIFEYFHLNSNNIEEFEKILNNFIYKTNDYYRLNQTITHMYNTGNKLNYLKKYKIKDILNLKQRTKLDFKNHNIIDIDKLTQEINNMKKAVESNCKAIEYYNNISNIFQNDRNFIVGHDVYDLLKYYLDIVHNKKIDEHYSQIVKQLDIDMNFINCLGNDISN